MPPTIVPEFDFSAWADLARDDAAAFELRRREVVEQFIAAAPDHVRQRLQRLQWRIDAERRRHKHPLRSSAVLYGMMWDALCGSQGLLAALEALDRPQASSACHEVAASAQVLPFRRHTE